jgi:xanthine dehydrogenase/oxidase
MYDIGKSMNPAIDIGQVEGAFIQGVGVLTSETLPFQDTGELNAVNTWRYKIPAHVSIPLELNTYLFPRSEGKLPGGAKNADTGIYSAKEVGEPPLVLANSVFFAIKAAIRASREERGLTPLFRLNAPATPQEVSRACEVDPGQLKTS